MQEFSTTNGHKVGSIITNKCTSCDHEETIEVEALNISAELDHGYAFTSYGSYYYAECAASAAGGYGDYEFRFEVYAYEGDTSADLVYDFSSDSSISWQRSYTSLVGSFVTITVRDAAGNEASQKFVV